MSERPIAQLGHPILLAQATPVPDPAAPDTRALIDRMLTVMAEAGGIGLAAPQVFASRRIVIATEINDRREIEGAPVRVLVNPQLVPLSTARELAVEGCLSIPALRGVVPRWREVGWRAQDRDGRVIEGEARGLFARILQHEVDHLDGVLFPMRMVDLSLLAADGELTNLEALLRQQREKAG